LCFNEVALLFGTTHAAISEPMTTINNMQNKTVATISGMLVDLSERVSPGRVIVVRLALDD
jgi:hypothetical protein